MMDQYTKNTLVICAMSLAGIVLLSLNFSERNHQQELYCEMVGIYKETKGEYGWPDYKGIAGEVCK